MPLGLRCPDCGSPVQPGSRFCIECGASLHVSPAPSPEAAPAPRGVAALHRDRRHRTRPPLGRRARRSPLILCRSDCDDGHGAAVAAGTVDSRPGAYRQPYT
ncbi:MAG: zinc ribbon domain-containing protein, partial [Actinomycetota bacterium]|nr:zinc ribbon domain-containing protein [Actinomycetota bacterium]